jgi:hypothetical protein
VNHGKAESLFATEYTDTQRTARIAPAAMKAPLLARFFGSLRDSGSGGGAAGSENDLKTAGFD